MRNVLIFDSKNAYKLSGMSAVDDGTQTIFIGFLTDTPIEVSLSSGQTLTYISGLIDILPEDLNISVGGQTIVLLAPPTSEGSLTVEQVGEYVYQERFYEAPTPVYDLPVATRSRLGGVIIGDGINVTEEGVISAQNIDIDDEMSRTSENPVQNKVITFVTDGLREGLDSCFRSVSDGKRKIASAITDKGVPTEPDASFDTMAEHVRAIPSGGGTIILYNALADFKHLPKKCNFYQGKLFEYEVPQSDYYVVFPAHSSYETARYDNTHQRQPLIDVCKLIFQELRNLFVNTMGLVRADSNGNHDGWYATGTNTDSYKYAYESFALPSDSQDAPFQYLTIRNAGTSSGNTLIRIGYTASIGQDGNTDILNINGQYQDLLFPSVSHELQGEYWMDYSINLWVLDNDRVTLWSVIGSLEDAVNVNSVINGFCVVKNIKVEGDDDTHSRAFYNAESGLVTLRDGRTKSVSQHPSMPSYDDSSGTALFYPAGLGTFSPDTIRRNGAIDAFRDGDYYFGIDMLSARLPAPSGMSGNICKVTVDDIEYIRVWSGILYKAGGN